MNGNANRSLFPLLQTSLRVTYVSMLSMHLSFSSTIFNIVKKYQARLLAKLLIPPLNMRKHPKRGYKWPLYQFHSKINTPEVRTILSFTYATAHFVLLLDDHT